MAVATIHHNLLVFNPISPHLLHKPSFRPRYPPLVSCRVSTEKEENSSRRISRTEMKVVQLALVALAAGALALVPVEVASAAKSGGRVGGQAFRSAAPRSFGPRINNSRTNIFINPPVAPPLVGGYGYGMPFGGWGWSPFTFFAPGPSIAVGVGGGFEVFAAILVFGAVAAVARRFSRRSDDDEDGDY